MRKYFREKNFRENLNCVQQLIAQKKLAEFSAMRAQLMKFDHIVLIISFPLLP